MNRYKIQFLAAIALTIAAIVAFSMSVLAGNLKVEQSFAPASIGAAKSSATYFVIINDTSTDDKLVSASTKAARKAELHNHFMENGVMKMRKVEALDVPAGSRVMLKPGGHHIMLFGLQAPLRDGGSFELQLNFERAGTVTLQVPIKPQGHKMTDQKSTE